MTEKPVSEEELSDEELEEQDGEELPERETMMVLDPGPGVGGTLDPIPWSDAETPDDRYEQ